MRTPIVARFAQRLDIMVATTQTDYRPSLTDSKAVAGDLVFRIRNASRKGQTLRLTSAKCTIGSGSHCTLRLRAPGLAAVHCLVVRGPNATVVRRWAADTRLNDRPFNDAVLSPGDRLSIGPIDLEVVSLGAAPIVAPRSTAQPLSQATREDGRKLDELAESLKLREAALAAETKQLHVQQTDCAAKQRSLENQRHQWQTELDDARHRLADQQTQLADQLAAVQSQQNTLDEQRRQWEIQCRDAATRSSAQAEQFAARSADLEIQRNVLVEERRQWEAQRASETAQSSSQTEQFATRLADLDIQRNVLVEERRQWEAQRASETAQSASQTEQFAARSADLEIQRNVLVEERRQWEAQRASEAAQSSSQTEQFAARSADLETQRNALAEQRRQWEARQAEAATQLTAQTERLNAQVAELQSKREDLERQQGQWQAERDEAERHYEQQRQEIAAKLTELESREVAIAEERRQWTERQAESTTAAKPVAAEESPEPASAQTKETGPVDLAEVFRRLGAKVDFEEEPEPAQPEPPRPAPAAQTSTPVKTEHEEESIEDYMRRLMQRVGAADSPMPSFTPPPSSREAMAQAEPDQPVTEKPRRPPISMAPRTVAPEKGIDIVALRELANLSAHSALSRHSRRLLIDTMHSKLAVSIVAVLAGVALLWMWRYFDISSMTYYAGLIAILAAVYWGIQYAILTGRLTISKSGRIDWNSSDQIPKLPPRAEPASPLATEETGSAESPSEEVQPVSAETPAVDAPNDAEYH